MPSWLVTSLYNDNLVAHSLLAAGERLNSSPGPVSTPGSLNSSMDAQPAGSTLPSPGVKSHVLSSPGTSSPRPRFPRGSSTALQSIELGPPVAARPIDKPASGGVTLAPSPAAIATGREGSKPVVGGSVTLAASSKAPMPLRPAASNCPPLLAKRRPSMVVMAARGSARHRRSGRLLTSGPPGYVSGLVRGRFQCHQCELVCEKLCLLRKHFRIHTNLRPFRCLQCEVSFKTKGNLTKHMKSRSHHDK
ncbi:unnamed protein product [Protopolystoma xenopodis]|uniref:C2H2-type domain-containing protein n=1 Tax=Protopolystoma xenopodis TaxID=117903 RepID=A0A3S5B679_9PLAT|nr:unnamed protein product [Protopolystoma xenopodis]